MGFLEGFKKSIKRSADEDASDLNKEQDLNKPKEQKYFFISCQKTADKEYLRSFIDDLFKSDTPSKIRSHEYRGRYYPKRFAEVFDEEMIKTDERRFFSIDSEKISFTVRSERLDEVLSLILIIDYDLADSLYTQIEKFIIREAVLAFETDLHDISIQNQTEINMLEWMGENPDDYPKCESSRNGVMEIDIKKNPGYVFKTKGYSLCAAYRMWFGSDSCRIFDRDTLRNYPAYENVTIDNDVTRITLYEDIKDYRNNRDKQLEFRNELHIDEIAERLIKQEMTEYRDNSDSEINIQEGQFSHGGVRLIQTYLKDGRTVSRSKADSVEERELDANGKEVFKIIKTLK